MIIITFGVSTMNDQSLDKLMEVEFPDRKSLMTKLLIQMVDQGIENVPQLAKLELANIQAQNDAVRFFELLDA